MKTKTFFCLVDVYSKNFIRVGLYWNVLGGCPKVQRNRTGEIFPIYAEKSRKGALETQYK